SPRLAAKRAPAASFDAEVARQLAPRRMDVVRRVLSAVVLHVEELHDEAGPLHAVGVRLAVPHAVRISERDLFEPALGDSLPLSRGDRLWHTGRVRLQQIVELKLLRNI